jgi:hypothetical protein
LDMTLKAAVHANQTTHQQAWCGAMAEGLQRHGVSVVMAPYDEPRECDFAVVWGWRQQAVINAGKNVLVMERGHIHPRMDWASCGWNGLQRDATYPKAPNGERWERHFGSMMEPWQDRDGCALILGQVIGDASLRGRDIHAWAAGAASRLREVGYDEIVYRPHPMMARAGFEFCPREARLSKNKDLADDLGGASVAVSFTSTAGVDAVLAGVPHIAWHDASMAWPVSGRAPHERVMPDRERWAHDLAWTQWTNDEIRSGEAWEALCDAI